MANETFEIICDDKTYVSKKMNPVRRAYVIEHVVNNLSSIKQENLTENVNVMANLLKEGLPKTMWEFLKDEDKKLVGTYEVFLDGLDDASSMGFLKWCLDKIQELNDFLGDSQKGKAQK